MEPKFENMKRAELQKCAKKAGIKANMKTDELMQALDAYHNQDKPADEVTIMKQSTVEKDVAATPSDKLQVDSGSELTAEAKPQRLQKGRGRGRRPKNIPPQNKPEPLQINSSSLTLQVDSVKEAKPQRLQKGRGSGRRPKNIPPQNKPEPLQINSSSLTKTPKSAQKRSHSEDEKELPPAKQQKVSPSQNVKKLEPIRPSRKSTRNRTFSMSPKSEVREKSKQSEQKVTRVDGDEESSSASEKRETGTITEELKTSTKKLVPSTKKTSIPLPKFKTSENITPGKSLNFKKVHKAQFEKLESIDEYLERKRKRIEALTQSNKKAPSCSKKTPKKTPNKTKNTVTPKDCKSTVKRTSFFTPKPSKQVSKRVTFHASRLKTPAKVATFVFGKTSTEKRVATPGARKSSAVTRSSSANRKSIPGSNTTPFKFTSTSINTPSKKFDLKASLGVQLPYKPYKGKLKPLVEIQPTKPHTTSHIDKAKENMKKPKLGNRQERQRAATKHRAQSRNNNMMTRRGLSVV